MDRIVVQDITIGVVRKAIKNMHLAVYPPSGRVRIAVPLGVSDDAIRLYIVSKLAWIKKNQRKFSQQERLLPREYKNRESHYFLGKRYLLNIIERDAPPGVTVRSKTYIDLYIRQGTPVSKMHEIMTEWYREQLKKLIPDVLNKWEEKLNISVNGWQVKMMKTKWGSCNIEQKRILINLELAKKPIQCLEYIIVHELVHLLERHHNDNFLNYLDTYLPNWKQLKKELNRLPVSHAEWSY